MSSMIRRYYRLIVAVVCTVLAALATIAGEGRLLTDGIAFDHAARVAAGWTMPTGPDPESAVVLVLLDDRSLAADEFAPLPRVFMAPLHAELITAVVDAGATAIGFDFIFEYTANNFSPDHDQPFLAALNMHQDRITLGRSAHTTAALPYLFALGVDDNPDGLGLVEIAPDVDNVTRRGMTLLHDDAGEPHPTLAGALLHRAGIAEMPEVVLVAPSGPLEVVMPSYSMVDVLRCAGQPELLRRVFAGKVVMVGSALPEEDRRKSPDNVYFPLPDHLAANREPPAADEGCALVPAGVSDVSRMATVPGAYLHAMVVDAVLRDRTITEVPLRATAAFAALLALLASQAGVLLRPLPALLTLVGGAGLVFLGDAALLQHRLWIPPSHGIIAAVLSLGAAFGARYLIEERRRRQVQHAFCHYLSPVLVERLAEGDNDLRLGGETRDVTVMFADLSGFTALSTRVGPQELMEVTNRYLAYIVDSVEETRGYVDKFIGDAVMAMWGAPASESDHAFRAVSGAMAAADRIAKARLAAEARGEFGFSVKIGLCSGPATVGNVGTAKRFNYTAVGETVNIASRLESLPGTYHCRIVIGESTAVQVRDRLLLCELDWVRVKGRSLPLTVFEPLVPLAAATAAERAHVEAYGRALALYRARDFAAARDIWRGLRHPLDHQAEETPAAVMAKRAELFLGTPPAADWDGVWYVPKG